MTGERRSGAPVFSGRDRVLVLAVALVARLSYLAIKPAIVFSDDVRGWKTVAASFAAGHNPYTTGLLNWPPVWPCVIWGLDRFSHWSGIGFVPLLWTVLIAIELLLIDVTMDLLRRFDPSRRAMLPALLGLAINPVAILQTTQHGNFDVLVSLLVLLSLRALVGTDDESQPRKSWLRGAGWLGLAAATKTVPLVLTPVVLAGSRRFGWRTVFAGVGLLCTPLWVGMSVIYVLDPAATRGYVLNYRSFGEFYGFSGIAYLLSWEWALPWLSRGFAAMMLILVGGLSWIFFSRPTPLSPRVLVLGTALLLMCVPTLGPGFATQYVYWYLPLLVISWSAWPQPRWRRLLIMGWLVGAATYCFEYAVQPALGNLLIRWFPEAHWALALSIGWSDRRSQILDRLPFFSANLAILIEAAFMLWRDRCEGETEKPRRGEALSV